MGSIGLCWFVLHLVVAPGPMEDNSTGEESCIRECVVRTLGDKLVAQCHSVTVSGRAESASIDAVVHVAGLCVNQEDVNAPSVYLTSASFCDSSPLSICPPLRLYFETWRSEPQG